MLATFSFFSAFPGKFLASPHFHTHNVNYHTVYHVREYRKQACLPHVHVDTVVNVRVLLNILGTAFCRRKEVMHEIALISVCRLHVITNVWMYAVSWLESLV